MATPKRKTSRPRHIRGRQLRGEVLVQAARAELGRMVHLSPQSDPINISTLAKRISVTRQSIYNNNLADIVAEFSSLQRSNFREESTAAVKRRPLEERIELLQRENDDLRRKLDRWVERWVAVEHNARMLGVDADALFSEPQKPRRALVRAQAKRC